MKSISGFLGYVIAVNKVRNIMLRINEKNIQPLTIDKKTRMRNEKTRMNKYISYEKCEKYRIKRVVRMATTNGNFDNKKRLI